MKELWPIFFLDRKVHFPQPPSPSNGMGTETLSCLDLDGVDSARSRSLIWRNRRGRIVNAGDSLGELSVVTPRANNLATNERPAAKKNATMAVLQTSDKKTARNDGHRDEGGDGPR